MCRMPECRRQSEMTLMRMLAHIQDISWVLVPQRPVENRGMANRMKCEGDHAAGAGLCRSASHLRALCKNEVSIHLHSLA